MVILHQPGIGTNPLPFSYIEKEIEQEKYETSFDNNLHAGHGDQYVILQSEKKHERDSCTQGTSSGGNVFAENPLFWQMPCLYTQDS